jgi:hypothetical protein
VLKGDQRSGEGKEVREGLYIVEWRDLKKKYDKKKNERIYMHTRVAISI